MLITRPSKLWLSRLRTNVDSLCQMPGWLCLLLNWHQRFSKMLFYKLSWIHSSCLPRAARVRARKILDLYIIASRLAHLQRQTLSIAVWSDILIPNLVYPDKLRPRVAKLDLEFINTLPRSFPSCLQSYMLRLTPSYNNDTCATITTLLEWLACAVTGSMVI